ncbi:MULTISPECIES: CaiB/BaiF CoA-transferase family protein [unclassified Rhodococcus (in: high G+C Gram-positive bacteria)]|uniref:CaiB/BaiF CoA transferase family protein n=1 Tax=unclassified Rhodococcus (in: high G+C Gram-positive bacteria) TaxID=192944 RepID=UPI00163B1B94|nr:MULTISPECIES: CoA transferase [unclassified Rhodococcus (in: high G+C Gram-positive bacteria)]MBC2644219.1 CoA transferase [Rhodococcus sp. 3A]MBC2891042.1 CoA transferase [Rhodococcus sp. 4CII]
MSAAKTGRRALDGVRVVDLTQALAGPFCTSLLADQGADVVKVEPPRGDFLRYTGPFASADEPRDYGGVFQSANRNKRSLVLDLKKPEARDVLLRLIDDADVLVENFSAGVMERFGLDYDTLIARNPRLVYASIRGFGDKAGGVSPYRDWPAFDIVAQAMGGLMSITGADSDHPVRVGSGVGDTVPGLFAAFGILSALRDAERTGQGQYVDVAMADAVLAISEVVVNTYGHTGQVPGPIGNQLQGFAPFDTVRAKDGVVALGAPHNPQWTKLAAVMGQPELIDDPRFATDHDRWINRDAVYEVVNAWTERHTVAELIELLGGTVPLGPILDAADIFADPHFRARDMLPTVTHPTSGRTVTVPGIAAKLSHTPGAIDRRAPLIGEHTVEILRESGLDTADLTVLVDAGAIVIPSSQEPVA